MDKGTLYIIAFWAYYIPTSFVCTWALSRFSGAPTSFGPAGAPVANWPVYLGMTIPLVPVMAYVFGRGDDGG